MCTPADFEECFGKSFLPVIFSFCQWALARALSESQSLGVLQQTCFLALPCPPESWGLVLSVAPGQEEEGWLPCGGVDRLCGSEWEQELVVNCGPEGSWDTHLGV